MKPTNLEPLTPVVFRRFKEDDVIALFPFEPADHRAIHCMSYQHVGQHGAANPGITRCLTTAATPAEAAPLALELRRIGYRLKILRRIPRNALAVRRQALTKS